MDFKLKHGNFEADCKVCNRAFSLTLAHCEQEGVSIVSGSVWANSIFIQTYAYYAYAVNFTAKGMKPPMDIFAFDEAITTKSTDSNLAELIEVLGENILSRLRPEGEPAKPEDITEEEKKRSPKSATTNSKVSTAAKLAST